MDPGKSLEISRICNIAVFRSIYYMFSLLFETADSWISSLSTRLFLHPTVETVKLNQPVKTLRARVASREAHHGNRDMTLGLQIRATFDLEFRLCICQRISTIRRTNSLSFTLSSCSHIMPRISRRTWLANMVVTPPFRLWGRENFQYHCNLCMREKLRAFYFPFGPQWVEFLRLMMVPYGIKAQNHRNSIRHWTIIVTSNCASKADA